MSYTGPVLEDVEAILDEVCMAGLGDGIGYKAAGAATFTPMRAYVEYGELARSLDGGQAIEQNIRVEVLCSQVPARPGAAVRITLGKLPGKTFKPVNVGLTDSGTHWAFEVERVNG